MLRVQFGGLFLKPLKLYRSIEEVLTLYLFKITHSFGSPCCSAVSFRPDLLVVTLVSGLHSFALPLLFCLAYLSLMMGSSAQLEHLCLILACFCAASVCEASSKSFQVLLDILTVTRTARQRNPN